jgi:diguanylate cyclase (GGDEF)-like protein
MKTFLHRRLSAIHKALEEIGFYWRVGYYGLLAAAFVHFAFIWLFLALGVPLMAWVNVISVAIYLYAVLGIGLRTLRTGDDRVIGWLVYTELIVHNLLATYLLSTQAGFQLYIYILVFLPFFVTTYSRWIYALRIIGALAVAMWIDVDPTFWEPKIRVEPYDLIFLHHLNLFLFLSVLAVLAYMYVYFESIQRTVLIEEVHKDPLTGSYNRRYIRNLVSEAKTRFGILLVDIDKFKEINDRYGHLAGDKVIVEVAKTIEEAVSFEGVTARWGGEEFLVYFDEIDEDGLETFARRILRSVRERDIVWQYESVKVTVTIGGAVRRENAPFEITLMRADEALYLGKSGGRDQFHIKA